MQTLYAVDSSAESIAHGLALMRCAAAAGSSSSLPPLGEITRCNATCPTTSSHALKDAAADEVAADASFELWLLTNCEDTKLLDAAANGGNTPAALEMRRGPSNQKIRWTADLLYSVDTVEAKRRIEAVNEADINRMEQMRCVRRCLAPGCFRWHFMRGEARDARRLEAVHILHSGPPLKLRKCERCRRAWYCSRACQAVAWPKHKRECARST